jgi:hypothetical protein
MKPNAKPKRKTKRSAVMWGAWNYNIGPISGLLAHRRREVKRMLEDDGRTLKHHTIRKVVVTWAKP